MSKPAPIPDQASAFFWEGAARGELLVQHCADCASFQYPPTVICEKCQSRDIRPARVSGRGTLYALTVMHQAFLPIFAENLPFTIALVDLDDAPGARLLTNIVDANPAELTAGDPLEVVFEPRGDYAVPQFRPGRPGAGRCGVTGGRQATVVGIGYSSVHRELGVDTRPLVVDASLAALRDAGLTPAEIDAVFEYPGAGSQLATNVQRLLGIGDLKAYGDLGGSGPSGLAAAMAAVAAVESGACDVALVFRSVNREWGQQSGKVVVPPAENAAQFSLPYGDFGGIIPSMGLRKYRRLAELGGSEEDYGQIALNARTWAAMYERGVLTKPLTMDDYLSSRFVAEPLRLLDCDYPVTGACAAIITTAERARDLAGRPVTIDSVAFGTGSRPDWTFSDDLLFGGTIGCARRLWEKSHVTAADVDVAELYDGFTHITISWIEALGLCGIGEFGDWVDGGKRIGPGGALPLNTNGGQLAAGRLHGLAFLTEAVAQLRGDCGNRQVPDARVAVVANAHGPQCGAMVLIRE